MIVQQQKEHIKDAMRGKSCLPGIESVRSRRCAAFTRRGIMGTNPTDPRWLDEQALHLRAMAKQIDKIVMASEWATNHAFEDAMVAAITMESIADDLAEAAMDIRCAGPRHSVQDAVSVECHGSRVAIEYDPLPF